MSVSDKIKAIPLISVNANTFDGAYHLAGTLPQPCSIIRFNNKTNRDITISFDGVTDNEYLMTGESLTIPAQLNAQPTNYRALFAKGNTIYIKGVVGAGFVYISGYYQS